MNRLGEFRKLLIQALVIVVCLRLIAWLVAPFVPVILTVVIVLSIYVILVKRTWR